MKSIDFINALMNGVMLCNQCFIIYLLVSIWTRIKMNDKDDQGNKR